MTDKLSGRIICGVGGLYTVLCDGGKILKCKARGVLRIKKITPLAGDRVTVRRGDGDEMGFFIDSIFPRKTVLDRPPVANIDTVFTVLCPAEPEPSLLGTDKLLCAISAAAFCASASLRCWAMRAGRTAPALPRRRRPSAPTHCISACASACAIRA